MLSGEGGLGCDQLRRGATEDDASAVVAGARAEVDDPVRVGHHGLVVLDHDHRLAGVDQPVEQAEELLHVGQVQAGGGLVKDVDTALLAQVGGELEPLAFTAGQGRQRLADGEVAETDIDEPLEDGVGGGRTCLAGGEELRGPVDRHRQHLADVLVAEVVLQHRCLEAFAPALLARDRDAGHHRQVGVDDPGAVADRAATLRIGAEERGLDTVGLRERLADRVEQAGVGRRVAASRALDRALVDHHDAVAAGQGAVDQ
ncbi:hypothetical protein SDC9_133018 [bioreactor metagenome]|uniref:Uncharacterized protein n=1 Tax=bioreactor metagenome TaxID=1076179 RepID=A0A645D9P7_9ZZZZ